jgi:hypothetical protein
MSLKSTIYCIALLKGVSAYSCDNSLITSTSSFSNWGKVLEKAPDHYSLHHHHNHGSVAGADSNHNIHDHSHGVPGPGDQKAQSYIKNHVNGPSTTPALSADRFPLSDITLLSGGRGWAMQNNTLQWLHMFDADRLLFNFRVTANVSTKSSSSYGGWEDSGSLLRGHITGGHFLSAAAQLIYTTQVSILFIVLLVYSV